MVMFSHGLGGRPDDYATLLTRWAAAGFVVAAPTFPHTSRGADNNVLDVLNQPADVSYALDQVLALDGKAGDALRGRLDGERVAAAGHSAGGVTTIGLFTASRDERLDAGVVFAGTALGVGTAFAGAAAPQLFVHGELDEVVEYAAGKAAYDKVPWPKAMLSLPKGDHGRALLSDGADAAGRLGHVGRVPALVALRRRGRQEAHPHRRDARRHRHLRRPPLRPARSDRSRSRSTRK